jgi:hypothetical protein
MLDGGGFGSSGPGAEDDAKRQTKKCECLSSKFRMHAGAGDLTKITRLRKVVFFTMDEAISIQPRQ